MVTGPREVRDSAEPQEFLEVLDATDALEVSEVRLMNEVREVREVREMAEATDAERTAGRTVEVDRDLRVERLAGAPDPAVVTEADLVVEGFRLVEEEMGGLRAAAAARRPIRGPGALGGLEEETLPAVLLFLGGEKDMSPEGQTSGAAVTACCTIPPAFLASPGGADPERWARIHSAAPPGRGPRRSEADLPNFFLGGGAATV